MCAVPAITPVTLLPFFFQNNLEGHTYGAELSGTYQVLDNWSLHLGYDLLQEHLHVKPGQFDLDDALNETSDPQQQVALRSSATLFGMLDSIRPCAGWTGWLRTMGRRRASSPAISVSIPAWRGM